MLIYSQKILVIWVGLFLTPSMQCLIQLWQSMMVVNLTQLDGLPVSLKSYFGNLNKNLSTVDILRWASVGWPDLGQFSVSHLWLLPLLLPVFSQGLTRCLVFWWMGCLFWYFQNVKACVETKNETCYLDSSPSCFCHLCPYNFDCGRSMNIKNISLGGDSMVFKLILFPGVISVSDLSNFKLCLYLLLLPGTRWCWDQGGPQALNLFQCFQFCFLQVSFNFSLALASSPITFELSVETCFPVSEVTCIAFLNHHIYHHHHDHCSHNDSPHFRVW